MKASRHISLSHCLTWVAALGAMGVTVVQFPDFALSADSEKPAPHLIPGIVGAGEIMLVLLGLILAGGLYLANRRRRQECTELERDPALAVPVTLARLAELTGRPGLVPDLRLPPGTRLLMSPVHDEPDHGGPLCSSPLAYVWWEKGRRHRVIYFPYAYLRRFRHDPQATAAILAHEIAHLEHQDADRETISTIATITFFAATVVAVAGYLHTVVALAGTASGGVTWQSALLAVFERPFLYCQLLLLVPLWFIPRRLPAWREAMADAFAARTVDDASVDRALSLTGGLHPEVPSGRRREQRENACHLGWKELALFAFLTTLTIGVGAIMFIRMTGFNASTASGFMVVAGVWGTALLNLGGVIFSMLAMLTQANPDPEQPVRTRRWRRLIAGFIAVVAGQTFAAVLIHGLPLVAPTVLATPGNDPPVPVLWDAALFGTFTSFGLGSLICTLFAVLGLALSLPPAPLWRALLPAFVCYVGGPLEVLCSPATEGVLTVIAAAITVLLLVAFDRHRPQSFPQGIWPRLRRPLVLAGLWLGLIVAWASTDDGHLSFAAHRASLEHDEYIGRRLQAIEHAARSSPPDQGALAALLSESPEEAATRVFHEHEAVRLLTRAATLSPWSANAQLNLEKCLTRYLQLNEALGAPSPPGWLPAAIACSDRALGNRMVYRVADRFTLLADSASLHLKAATPADDALALAHLEFARSIRLRYPAIASPEDAASMLYNLACARCRIHGPDRKAYLALLEAIGAASQELGPSPIGVLIASHALVDPDLAAMNLQSPSPAPLPAGLDARLRKLWQECHLAPQAKIRPLPQAPGFDAVSDHEVMTWVRHVTRGLVGL